MTHSWVTHLDKIKATYDWKRGYSLGGLISKIQPPVSIFRPRGGLRVVGRPATSPTLAKFLRAHPFQLRRSGRPDKASNRYFGKSKKHSGRWSRLGNVKGSDQGFFAAEKGELVKSHWALNTLFQSTKNAHRKWKCHWFLKINIYIYINWNKCQPEQTRYWLQYCFRSEWFVIHTVHYIVHSTLLFFLSEWKFLYFQLFMFGKILKKVEIDL